MSDNQGEKPKFDPNAWEDAYNQAEDLPPDQEENQKEPFSKEGMQKMLDKAGIPLQVSSMDDYFAAEERREYDRKNMVAAEFGDATVIRVKGENREKYFNLVDENSWRVFQHLVEAYKRHDDQKSVNILLSIFPAHSQMQAEIEKRLGKVAVDPTDEGFDVREGMGSVVSAENGHQYDLLPGNVDFRKYVHEGKLDIESFVETLLEDMKIRDQGYSDNWDEINRTAKNVKNEFGEEVWAEVWNKFEAKYKQYQDNQPTH